MTPIPAASNPTAASAGPALSEEQIDRDAADALELAQYLRVTPIKNWLVGLGSGDKEMILEALALFAAARSTEGGRIDE